MPAIRSPKDFISGVLFVALGVAVLIYGSRYAMGTASRMGPGYFPRILGVILLLLGTAVSLRSCAIAGARLEKWQVRPFVVIAVVLGFAAIVETAGLAISAFLLVVGAALANPGLRLLEAMISGLILSAFVALVFVLGLGIQLPILPNLTIWN